LVPDRFAELLPLGELGVGIESANLILDLVEPLVGGEWKRRALVAGVECLHEVAARVHVILSPA